MFRSAMKKAASLIEYTTQVFVVLSGILTVLMALTATYGVVRRYVFHNPEPYSYELSTMFLLFSFVFAVAAVERLDRNIRVDFLIIHLPENIRRFLLNIISPIMGLFFCVILTWKGWDVAMYSFQIKEKSMSVWAVPLAPIKIVVPIGYSLLCLVLLMKLIRGIAQMKGGPNKP